MKKLCPNEINRIIAKSFKDRGQIEHGEIFIKYAHCCAGELILKLLNAQATSDTVRDWYRCMMINDFDERKMVIWKLYSAFLNRTWEIIQNACETEDLSILASVYNNECNKAFQSLINRESFGNDLEKEFYDIKETIIDLWDALIKMDSSFH